MGGFVMAYIPSASVLTLVYTYWGISTVLLFWAGMIRATKEWGDVSTQGKAFGILDSGRGLVAATSASVAVALFASALPGDVTLPTPEQNQQGLQSVIYLYTGLTIFASVLIWVFIPDTQPQSSTSLSKRQGQLLKADLLQVLRNPTVWLISGVLLCSYCGYKALDNYGLYTIEALGMDQLQASAFVANATYMRIVAPVMVGLIADRFSASKTAGIIFTLLIISYLVLAIGSSLSTISTYGNLIVTFVCVYSLRALYFPLLKESKTPMHVTGATIGTVSLLGYSPDFFFGPITGRILDHWPGLQGHMYCFALLAATMIIGVMLIAAFRRHTCDS
jgi:nitrate/nitrite transporter NarK